MFGVLIPGRGASIVVVGLVLFVVQLVVVMVLVNSSSSGALGVSDADIYDRPTLSSHLPLTLPGWHRRSYLPADGEAITEAAQGRGIAARLALGEDLERFRIYDKSGINGATATYIKGDMRIAIGIMRDPSQTPDWFDLQTGEAERQRFMVERLKLGEIAAIVHGLPFQRRGGVSTADGDPIGYERYVARVRHDLVIDVISNAPQQVVEQLLARLDAAALQVQLTTPDDALDAANGVILHSFPETWPEPPIEQDA